MATFQYELVDPPSESRARELWLQHAAGFIVFEDIRRYAMELIEPGLSAEAVAAAKKGIDNAVYGLMMVIDGVSGGISNDNYNVFIDFVVRLAKRKQSTDDGLLSEVDLRHGDGMCMGYHGWLERGWREGPNERLKLTGAAILVFRASTSHRRPRQLSRAFAGFLCSR
jgi:hypothetical protein